MTDIIARLEATLSLPELPDSARKNARDLFESLSRPVIVAVMGPKGSGKSALVNLFLKERLLPDGLSANLIEIVPGPEFAAEVGYPDGRLEATDRDELAEVDAADRVHIAAPNPVLNDMVLIEASGGGSEDTLETNIQDAAERADILVWCTQTFTDDEKALWAKIDPQKKDHAFLLLTKADKMARKRKLAQALAALTSVAQDEFAGLLPIATLQALKALDVDPIDEDLWAGSGADGLINRITDHVRHGRQADFDQAELFLARYTMAGEEIVEEDTGRRTSKPRVKSQRRRRSRMTREVVAAMRNEEVEATEADAPAEEAPKPEKAKAKAETPAAPEAPTTRPLEPEDTDETPETVTAKPKTKPTAPVEPAEPPEKVVTRPIEVESAADEPPEDAASPKPADSLADRLTARRRIPSKQLLTPDTAAEAGLTEIGKAAKALDRLKDDPEKVLNLCADTADTLQNVFENGALPANLIELRDEVLQTCEHMTLLQLENTAGSAADAVTILLQLKRDFEARKAA